MNLEGIKKALASTTERVSDREARIKLLAEQFADSMDYTGEKRERAIKAYVTDMQGY